MTDPMQTLVERIADAGARRTSAGWESAGPFAQVLAVLRAEHADDIGASPLKPVADVFGLDDTDGALLWTAAASDLDATVAQAYALLRGLPGACAPSVGLALELAGVATASPEPFERLGTGSPLQRHRLLEVTGTEPWLARTLTVPGPVLQVLAGGLPVDPVVDRVRAELVALPVAGSDEVARAIRHGVPLVWIRSAAGLSGTSMAAAAFEQVGLRHLAIDLRRHAGGAGPADGAAPGTPPGGLTGLVTDAARVAGLRGWGLVVLGCEVVADSPERSVFTALEAAAVPVVAISTRPWNPLWSPRFPVVLEAAPLTTADRLSAWRTCLGELGLAVDSDPELPQALLGLRLSAEDIAEAARLTSRLAATRDEPLSAALVREAARRVGGAGAASADRVVGMPDPAAGPRFSDLVLPADASESLHRLVSWARHRDSIAADGILRGRGRGIAALFTGNPGTGKTLAAHVIAEELSIELFQVDLSSVVDKYIGETQKNLERVFQAAEALDVVLFFDEADALFGSRSGVSDARDRYANQEVAYLLQRMEHFDGITILSTNLRGNLDKAFSRRMSFIVNFPDPDPETRVRLWRHHLDQLGSLDAGDPVDVDYLARTVELAGGDVRNIVLAAAYDAAGAGESVGNRHVVEAAVREYRKLGRVTPDSGLRGALRQAPITRGAS